MTKQKNDFSKVLDVKSKGEVIIWGADDFNTLGLLRQLGDSNLDVLFLLKGKPGYASVSKYCKNYYSVKSNEEALEYLLNHYAHTLKKPVIITSGDGISVFIDQNKELLERHFVIPGTLQSGILTRYTDKNQMTALASEIGILTPHSRHCQWDSNIDDVKFPCLIKPSHQKPGHYNEFKYQVCHSKDELRHILSIVRHDSEFILQEYINKEKDILVYGARMWDGHVELSGSFIKDRLAECGSGSHGIISNEIPECVNTEHIKLFLDRIDYHGLFSFEYGLFDHKAYFFEVNLRNDGTSHYFYQAGANIPLAYVFNALDIKDQSICTKVINNHEFIDELFDFENVLNGNISRSVWKADMKSATIFKYYSPEDPSPWNYMKKRRWIKIFKDMLLKRWRLYIVGVLDKFGLRK